MRIMLIGAASSNHTKRWAKTLINRGHQVLLVTCLNQKDDIDDCLLYTSDAADE